MVRGEHAPYAAHVTEAGVKDLSVSMPLCKIWYGSDPHMDVYMMDGVRLGEH